MLTLLFACAVSAAPDGYESVTTGRGVVLWQQVVPGGEPDFVLEVDLDVARLESVIDPVGDPSIGGLDRHTAATWWADHAVAGQFATVNAAFFAANVTPTTPAFGLRTPDYLHPGYGTNVEYPGQQVALWLYDDGGADLIPADPSALAVASNPDRQIVALTVDANKGPNSWVPRTFLGLMDAEEGAHRTALLFVSELATQAYAEGELARWGATQQMMLDGASSTHLIVQGTPYVHSGRAIPHLIRVVEGPGDDPDSEVDTDVDSDPEVDTDTGDVDDSDTESPASDSADDPTPMERGCSMVSAPATPTIGLLLALGLGLTRRRRRLS